MPKIKAHITIRSNEDKINYDVNCIYQEDLNKITYKEPDNTTTTYDYNENILIRNNDNLTMNYKFIKDEETTGNIYIKDLNKSMDILIKTKNLVQDKKNIEIEYIIEDNKFKYSIEVK